MTKSKYKVIHISTYVNGGAGTAAYRIHEALLENNVDSTFLSLDFPLNKSAKACVQFKSPENSLLQNVINKFISVSANRFKLKLSKNLYYQNRLRKLSPSLRYEWISLPFATTDILSHRAVKDADIIHLHWVSGFLNYSSFFTNNTKPVVWTLHDMNPFQGLFHYKEDEVRNRKSAKDLDHEVFEIKRKYIQKRKFPLSIVSPSAWLLKAASESSMFSGIPATCISNPLDTSTFCPTEVKNLKKQLKIPEKNTVFLFVTQTVENHRKGFGLLVEALNQLKHLDFTLLVVGQAVDLQIPGLQVLHLGSIFNNEILRDYYSLADAFIIPSLEDNLPNVMIEAMACGTPVLAFNVGGMSEVIKDGLNGLKAYDTNALSLKNLLEGFVVKKCEFDSNLIRGFTLNNFSADLIASKYLRVYNDVLSSQSIQQ